MRRQKSKRPKNASAIVNVHRPSAAKPCKVYRIYQHDLDHDRLEITYQGALRHLANNDEETALVYFRNGETHRSLFHVERLEQLLFLAYAKIERDNFLTAAKRLARLLTAVYLDSPAKTISSLPATAAYALIARREEELTNLYLFMSTQAVELEQDTTVNWHKTIGVCILALSLGEEATAEMLVQRMIADWSLLHPESPENRAFGGLPAMFEALIRRDWRALHHFAQKRHAHYLETLEGGEPAKNWRTLFDPMAYVILLIGQFYGLGIRGEVTADISIRLQEPVQAEVVQQSSKNITTLAPLFHPENAGSGWKIIS